MIRNGRVRFLVVFAVALLACNAIIGLEPGELFESGPDGSTDGTVLVETGMPDVTNVVVKDGSPVDADGGGSDGDSGSADVDAGIVCNGPMAVDAAGVGSQLIAGNPANDDAGLKPYGMLVVDNRLILANYYRPKGALYTVQVDGGAEAFLLPGSTAANGLVNDGTDKIVRSYFQGPGQIRSCLPDGGSDAVISNTGPAADGVRSLSATSSDVWFGSAFAQGIHHVNRVGGAILTGQPNGTIGTMIADSNVSARRAFYCDESGPNVVLRIATVTPLAAPTSIATTMLADLGAAPTPLAEDATHIYYWHSDESAIKRVKKDGLAAPENMTPCGLPVTISVAMLLVDASYIYFISPRVDFGGGGSLNTDHDQKLYRVPIINTGSTTAISLVAAIGSGNVNGIAQDANWIYWATYGRDNPPNGPPFPALYRAPK